MSKGNRYGVSRGKITAALYAMGSEPAASPASSAEARAIVADRIQCVADAISASPMLRDELIACGLSPMMVEEGLKHHREYLLR